MPTKSEWGSFWEYTESQFEFMKVNLVQNLGILSLCFVGVCLAATARAGLPSIEGSVSFQGIPVLNGPVSSATAITNFSSAAVAAGAPGSYAGLGGLVAVWSPFVFSPALAPVAPLWSFSTNGLAYSFDATSILLDLQFSGFINLHGSGIAHLTGYADTPGTWSMGISQIGSSVAFVASTSVSATNLPWLQCTTNATGTMNFTWNALPGQPYQVQTSTNLSGTNWVDLGGVVTTTNPAAAWSNAMSTDPSRFYRVMLVP